jgi:hypothetical protein
MLNRYGKSGHLCLVPDFKWNGFNYSPLRIMLLVGLSCIAFIILGYISSIPCFIRDCIMKWCWILWLAFLYLLKWSSVFLVARIIGMTHSCPAFNWALKVLYIFIYFGLRVLYRYMICKYSCFVCHFFLFNS